MTDNNDQTNLQLAELLKKQTYDERIEMAQWFAEVLSDALDDATRDGKPDADLFAFWFGSWAEGEIDSYEPASEPQS